MFLDFMNSTAGRVTRVVLGLALIVIGAVTGGLAGFLVAIIGLEPLVAGALDVSLLALLMHEPLKGAEYRTAHPAH